MVRAYLIVFLGFIWFSFLEYVAAVKNAHRLLRGDEAYNVLFSKSYIKPSKWMRKLFHIYVDKITIWAYIEFYISIIAAIWGPVNCALVLIKGETYMPIIELLLLQACIPMAFSFALLFVYYILDEIAKGTDNGSKNTKKN